jgi:hypothetical protein
MKKEYSQEHIKKLINQAHKSITKIKGKEYAPTSKEIQTWIDKHIEKDEELSEKWSKKYKDSIDCNNPKGFSQKAHCDGKKKKQDTKESMGADSAGAFEPAFGSQIVKRPIGKLNNFNESLDSSVSAGASYDVPLFGTTSKGRKNPLSIGGPETIKKSRAVKDKNFPKYGGPGGIFIKIKEKCKKFPYCNQGDINAIEVLKEAINETSEKYGIPRSEVEKIVLNEINNIFM